jgi:superfamily II DNA or RNA helicase
LIIFDEGHHAEAKTYVKIRNHFKSARCVYLSATPFHSDEFEKSFKYVYKEEFKEMCQNNIIRDFKLITVPGEVPKKDECFNFEEETFFINTLIKSCEKEDACLKKEDTSFGSLKILIICSNISHCNEMCKFIKGNEEWDDYPCYVHHSKNVNKDIDLKKFEQSKKKSILIICSALLEGWDHKNVYCIGIHANIGSGKKFTQLIGRALRKLGSFDQGKAQIVTFQSNKIKYQGMMENLKNDVIPSKKNKIMKQKTHLAPGSSRRYSDSDSDKDKDSDSDSDEDKDSDVIPSKKNKIMKQKTHLAHGSRRRFSDSDSDEEEIFLENKTKTSKRKCSNCRKPGHNKRTCPNELIY